MQKWEKPKCTVLMRREENKIQSLKRMVRLWWGGKKAPKSWRRITDNAVVMICDELVRSLLVNALQKALQREADISVTGKGGGMEHSKWLSLAHCASQRQIPDSSDTVERTFTRQGPFLLWHDTVQNVFLQSAPQHMTLVRVMKNSDSSHGLFSFNQALCVLIFLHTCLAACFGASTHV